MPRADRAAGCAEVDRLSDRRAHAAILTSTVFAALAPPNFAGVRAVTYGVQRNLPKIRATSHLRARYRDSSVVPISSDQPRRMPVHKFGELESAVIAVIWDAGGEVTTVRQVYESLSRDRDIAYTTVLSTMDNLHRKGWLTKERRGKLLYFAPTMTRAEYSAQLMRDAMCAGGDSGLVLPILSSRSATSNRATCTTSFRI